MPRRYERASTVQKSNKGFEEWGDIFGDEVMAAALIDRLVHPHRALQRCTHRHTVNRPADAAVDSQEGTTN